MRRRLPLLMPLAILVLLGPAMVAGASGGSRDPCLSPGALLEDPKNVLVIAEQCTLLRVAVQVNDFRASVNVVKTQEGQLVITIAAAYADYAETFLVVCTDPHNLPKAGDHREWNADCRLPGEWLA